jgi:dihydrofolate synthase/folylpolyglutamate synthase
VSFKLQQAIETLYGLERRRDKLGLDGTRLLLGALGDPQRAFRSVHVAGTNGKGSVCALIERVLREAGQRTGLYTSPHLVDFRERIRLDGRWADDSALEARLEVIQALPEAADRTFFEVATALAFDHFTRAKAEWVVAEVGLGGRLDSTNVLEPEVAVITRVSIDHAEILGTDLATIAAEKAGIVKPGVPVVTGPQAPEAMAVIERICAARGAPLIDARAAWAGRTGRAPLPRLRGAHQLENVMIAAAAIEVLRGRGVAIDSRAEAHGLRAARWPGRLDRCPHVRRLWWDGAHNLDAFRALTAAWRGLGHPPPALVLALSRDKDAREIARALREGFGAVPAFATRTRNPRAMPVETLEAALGEAGFETGSAPDVPAAVRAALARAGRGRVLLTGSLFAVGEAMEAFGGAPGEWL